MPDRYRLSYRAIVRSGLARRFLGWSILALIAAGLLWLATLAPSYQACINEGGGNTANQEAKKSNEEAQRRIPIVREYVFLRCEGAFLDANSVLLTAIATLAIAGFTWTLKRSTDRLWKAGEDQHAISNRAFVFIDGFNYELTTAADARPLYELVDLPERYRDDPGLFVTRFAVQPRWKNGGNTPTRRMTIQVDWQGPVGPIPPEYGYRNAREPFFLAPKAIEASRFLEIPAAQSLVDFGAFHHAGVEPLIFIWGRADYEDVFGRPHFIQWCHQLRLERHRQERMSAGFIQWGDYNRTDDDA